MKSVFLGIHSHSNYSDILGRACSTGVPECTVAKSAFGTAIRKATLLACKKTKDRKKSNHPKTRKMRSILLAVYESNCFFFFFLSLPPYPPSPG